MKINSVLVLTVLCGGAVVSQAFADEPEKYQSIRLTDVSSYDRAAYEARKTDIPRYAIEKVEEKDAPETEACGYQTYSFQQESIGSGWGELEMPYKGGIFTPLKKCSFPAPGKKWAAEEKAAAALMKKADIAINSGDVIASTATEWVIHRHEVTGKILFRAMSVNHYSSKHKVKVSRCLTSDKATVCEAIASKTVTDLNAAHHYYKEAEKLKASKPMICRLAAWRSMRLAERGIVRLPSDKQTMAHRLSLSKEEKDKGLTYKTKWDGTLSEADVNKTLAKYRENASKLFDACGGTKALRTDSVKSHMGSEYDDQ